MNQEQRLSEILVEQKIITPEQLLESLKKKKILKRSIGETLLKMNLITEQVFLDILIKEIGVEFVNIAEDDYKIIDQSLSKTLDSKFCKSHRVLPLFQIYDDDIKELTLAMADPLDQSTIDKVARITACNITPVLATSSAILGGIEKMFSANGRPSVSDSADISIKADGETVVVVNKLLSYALELNASDIHIEPQFDKVYIRMRIDGILNLISSLTLDQLPSIVSRLKIMGSSKNSLMKIEEKRVPQDGSFSRAIGGRKVDFRVSTFPSIYGEKVVLRLLFNDPAIAIRNIADLKMPYRVEKQFLRSIHQASGIIIATGPTGSGKSTTLHAAIMEINEVGVNIITVEDPVEYHVGRYVIQSGLIPQSGYTFTKALQAILRQDPDVILIGEIRDTETAEIAIQAALTGHLILTTLHTDDAAGAVVRLVDLGIEQFLVSSTVVSAVNQRLVRKVCQHCAESYVPTRSELINIGIDAKVADEILRDHAKYKILKGTGCEYCRKMGYQGRQGAYEFLFVTPAIKKLILSKTTSDVIAEEARRKSNINMVFEEGIRLVLTGITTFDELKRIPRGDYELKSVSKIIRDEGREE